MARASACPSTGRSSRACRRYWSGPRTCTWRGTPPTARARSGLRCGSAPAAPSSTDSGLSPLRFPGMPRQTLVTWLSRTLPDGPGRKRHLRTLACPGLREGGSPRPPQTAQMACTSLRIKRLGCLLAPLAQAGCGQSHSKITSVGTFVPSHSAIAHRIARTGSALPDPAALHGSHSWLTCSKQTGPDWAGLPALH